MMLMTGIAALGVALPVPEAGAKPSGSGGSGPPPGPLPPPTAPPPVVPPPAAATQTYLFHDEFDGPAGSAPDPSKWAVAKFRETIKNPVFWDRPENMGQYRDSRRNVFLDGKSNLVIRATRENGKYFSGKIQSNWRGGIDHTWEARVKLNCLTAGTWPAWWLLNDDPAAGGEVDILEWYGNGDWPAGTTVHAMLDGTSFATQPTGVDGGWHTWRCVWDDAGMHFWEDYVDGAPPYFEVPANSLDGWSFNNPGFQLSPVLNLAVSGSGGGDPKPGTYPADMLVDWVRVW
jgi:hypothetical protein